MKLRGSNPPQRRAHSHPAPILSQRLRFASWRLSATGSARRRNFQVQHSIMGHEASTDSRTESHPVLLRLRRTALGPEPAEDRRSAVSRLPRHRQPETGTRRRALPHRRRRFGLRSRTDRGTDFRPPRPGGAVRSTRRLSRTCELRRRADATRATRAVRRPYEDGHALQADRPRRRPLLAARRRARARASRDAVGSFSVCSVPLCSLYGHANAVGIPRARRHRAL